MTFPALLTHIEVLLLLSVAEPLTAKAEVSASDVLAWVLITPE